LLADQWTMAVEPLQRGLNWLATRVEGGQHTQPSPIGFYFARLWYYERLYPLTFAASALTRAAAQLRPTAAVPVAEVARLPT
jgi:squalene-hopene/tetraprenyl-beta-curcumene cyclase